MEAISAQRSMGGRATAVGGIASAARAGVAAVIALCSILAAVGILYLIRSESLLAIGPHIRGALPLQQLAGGEAQPLLRMVVAWVPAGLIAGLALASLVRLGPLARVVTLAVLAAVVLLLAGAAADAIAITDPLGPHLLPQLARVGTWTAVALFTVGSLSARRFDSSSSTRAELIARRKVRRSTGRGDSG